MLRWIVVTVAMPLLAAGQAAGADDLDAAELMAPDFVLESTSGPNLRLSEYRSEVVLVTFWGSWCGDCRTQLQRFGELYEVFHPVGFELLAVSLDRELSQAADTARSLGLEFPVLHDRGGAVAELYEVDDLPLVVLIDREGAVREVVQGFSRADEDFFVSRVRGLLRE